MSAFSVVQKATVSVVVCFAVKEEAKYFIPATDGHCAVLITGMGRKNAAESLRRTLSMSRPGIVITAGFAGGLNPGLQLGKVIFEADPESGLAERLLQTGAIHARFHCAERVA